MARTPRASISKTSGQGISRLSYQKGYALGNKGAQGKTPSVGKFDSTDIKTGRHYGKSSSEDFGDINVSYGDTLDVGDLGDVKAVGKLKPPKASPMTKAAKPKAWKK